MAEQDDTKCFSVNPLLYLPLEEGKEDSERATQHAAPPWDPSAAWKRWGSHMHFIIFSFLPQSFQQLYNGLFC